MRLYHAISILAAVFKIVASPTKRQSSLDGPPPLTLLSPGSIVTPNAGTVVGVEESFPFSVAVPEWNHCHPGYTPVDVYILSTQPTVDSLNSTHQFSDYLYYYGEYMVNNFPNGLPKIGTPPPPGLTMPDLAVGSGASIYLVTMETIEGCPPDGYYEYAIDSKSMTFGG